MEKKLTKQLSIAAIVGFLIGTGIYFALPKEYESTGMLEVGRVARAQIFTWADLHQVLDLTSTRNPGVMIRYFRTDAFQYTIKMRSTNLALIGDATKKMMSALEDKFRQRYESLVRPKHQELESLREIRANLSSYLKSFNGKAQRSLADTYYFYQIQSMVAAAHEKELNAEIYLNEDATRFFDYSKLPSSSDTPVFPNFASIVALCVGIALLVTFTISKLSRQ